MQTRLVLDISDTDYEEHKQTKTPPPRARPDPRCMAPGPAQPSPLLFNKLAHALSSCHGQLRDCLRYR